MQSAQSHKPKPGKRTVLKITKWALPAIAGLVVLAFLLVPVFVSSGIGKRMIVARINRSVGGRADIGELSMGWLRGITVRQFTYDDRSTGTSVAVKRISTKPHYGSLLRGSLSFGRTVVDEPSVSIDLRSRRLAGSGDGQETTARQKQTAPVVLPVERIDLSVNNGSFKVIDRSGTAVELSDIDSTNRFCRWRYGQQSER